jgi:hypothetical protein
MVGLSGCYLKSVHPLITADDGVILDGLEGVYETDGSRWTFASDNDPEAVTDLFRRYDDDEISIDPGETDSLNLDGYLIMFENLEDPNPKAELFIGTIGEINGNMYLNLKLFAIDLGINDTFVGSHLFNVNTFSKIELTDNELIMEPFASSWIKDQILNNRVRIKHETVTNDHDESSEILITASTSELKQFVSKYGDEEDAYEDPITLNRVTYEAQ